MPRSLPDGSNSAAGNNAAASPAGKVHGASSRPDQKLGRRRRLVKAAHFREAYAQNRCFAGRFMVMWLRAAPDACLRVGVVSGRGVGGAVERNRARRRLREVFRRHRCHLTGAVDVVLVARRAITRAGWDELVNDFLELAARAGLTRKA